MSFSMNAVTEFFQTLLSALRKLSLRDQMKTKNCSVIVLLILATATAFWLLGNSTPTFHTIVSETHKQISNIKNIPSNIRTSANNEMLTVNPVYLEPLGFAGVETFIGENISAEEAKNGPVIATSVTSGAYKAAQDLLASVKKYVTGRLVVFFDLGLNSKDGIQLKKTCNISRNNCVVKTFNFNKFPGHVRNLNIHSYRPICIQMALHEYGSVIWADLSEYFISGDIANCVKQAQKVGVVAWTIQDPTSSFTHPTMFSSFKVKKEDYYFHRGVKATHLILYNTKKIHDELMLPWVKCALSEECLNPTGAQDAGCTYRPKPLYLYTGCHKYDMSALNVILGKMFNYVETAYAAREEDKIFGIESVGNFTPPFLFKSTHKNL